MTSNNSSTAQFPNHRLTETPATTTATPTATAPNPLVDSTYSAYSAKQSAEFLGVSSDLKREWISVEKHFPVKIPRFYLDLIKSEGLDGPLARMALPHISEITKQPPTSTNTPHNTDKPTEKSFSDPLGEEEHEVVKGLIHRYKDRALLLVTTGCAIYCRFCTRKRLVGKGHEKLSEKELQDITSYLRDHPEINEVIISGGDPLAIPLKDLEHCLEALRTVPSVKTLRLGTRVPAACPQLITHETAETLARFNPMFILTHFNHPNELTPQALHSLHLLADAGLPLVNQTVLLAGINDDTETLSTLFQNLLASRVKPYYLHQCDLTTGASSFRTPITKGIQIMKELRSHLSGLALPVFVVDLPPGRGKVPLTHNYLQHPLQPSDEKHLLIQDPWGNPVKYPDI